MKVRTGNQQAVKLMPQPPDHVNVEWELGEPWQELSEKSGMSIASVPSDIAKAAVKAKVRVGDEVIEIVDHVDIPDASFTINASMTSPQNPEENTTYSVAFSVNPPLPEGTDVNWTVDGMEQLERSGTMIKAIDFRGGQATVSAEFTFNDEPRTVNLSFPLELNPTIGNPKQSDVDGTLQSN